MSRIASGAEYRMEEQFQNFPIVGAKFWFFKLKKILEIC